MGFYGVFQGVVFSAVASKNRLTCHTSVIPAFLPIITTITINITVHSKLAYYKTQKLKLLKVEHLAGLSMFSPSVKFYIYVFIRIMNY